MSEYTSFEKLEYIRNIIAKRAAEVFTYKNWSDDFAAKYIREIPDILTNSELELKDIDISVLTERECDLLGFGSWSKDNPMKLIPLWTLPFLPEKIKCSSISGNVVIDKSNIDNDNRFGYLAYGIIPSDLVLK